MPLNRKALEGGRDLERFGFLRGLDSGNCCAWEPTSLWPLFCSKRFLR